ncbi:MAG: hypothetical protein IPN52_12830 [Micrococcales bacterium]|nr:hypothetical protein [Micrococcales bacterium]
MSAADEFLDRVMPHVAELGTDRFRHKSWRFENRPTSETVGILPPRGHRRGRDGHTILDVEGYPDNVPT